MLCLHFPTGDDRLYDYMDNDLLNEGLTNVLVKCDH